MISSLLPSRFRKGTRGNGNEEDLVTSEAMWEKPMRAGAYSAIAPVPGGEGSGQTAAARAYPRGDTDSPPPDATKRARGTASHFQDFEQESSHNQPKHHQHPHLRRSDGQGLSADSLLKTSGGGAEPVQTGGVGSPKQRTNEPSASLNEFEAPRTNSMSDEGLSARGGGRAEAAGGGTLASSSARLGSSDSRNRKHRKPVLRRQNPQRFITVHQLGAQAFAMTPNDSPHQDEDEEEDDEGGGGDEDSPAGTPDVASEDRSDFVSENVSSHQEGIEHQRSEHLHPLAPEGWDSTNPLISTSLAQEVARQSSRLQDLERDVDELHKVQAEGAQLLEERLEDLVFAWDHRESLVDGALAERNGRGSSAVTALRHTLRQAAAEEALTQIRREGDSIVAGTAAQLALLENRVKRAENETLLSALADIRGNLVQFLLTGTLTAADTLAPATVPPGLTLYGMFSVVLKQVAHRVSPLLQRCGCGRGSSVTEDDLDDDEELLDFGHAGGEQRRGGGRRTGGGAARSKMGRSREADALLDRDNPSRTTPQRIPMPYPGQGGGVAEWEPHRPPHADHEPWQQTRWEDQRGGLHRHPLPHAHGAGRVEAMPRYADDYRDEQRFAYPAGQQGGVHDYTPRSRGGYYDPVGPHLDDGGSFQGSPPEQLPRWGGPMDAQRYMEPMGPGGGGLSRVHHRMRTAPVADTHMHAHDSEEEYGVYRARDAGLHDDSTSTAPSLHREAPAVGGVGASYAYEGGGMHDPGRGAARMRRPPASYGTYPPRMAVHSAVGGARQLRPMPGGHAMLSAAGPPNGSGGVGMRARRDHRAGGVGDIQSVNSTDSRAHDFDGIE